MLNNLKIIVLLSKKNCIEENMSKRWTNKIDKEYYINFGAWQKSL